jgi:hypothetical protein
MISVPAPTDEWLEGFRDRLWNMVKTDNARALERMVYSVVLDMGCSAVREEWVKYLDGFYTGRIDLVITKPFQIAIEIDNKTPRVKSILKLQATNMYRIIILRGRACFCPVGIQEVIGLSDRSVRW